jgi:hypothetical protein
VATAVIALQAALPRARVVYCSATGVSEIGVRALFHASALRRHVSSAHAHTRNRPARAQNMAYMSRMGFWGAGSAFANAEEFLGSMKQRGLGARAAPAR